MLTQDSSFRAPSKYWQARPWKVRLQTGSEVYWFEMTRPFALIGAHPRCDIQVGSSHTPAVTYLACCFRNCIEVWPTAAIAFPRWGIVLPEHDLLVGRHRISLHHPIRDDGGQLRMEAHVPLKTTFGWDGLLRTKTLMRAVTIIGDTHPSAMRFYHQDLAVCDHALVAQQGKLWMIDLVPDRWGPTSDHAPVSCLESTEHQYRVGQVTIRLGEFAEPSAETLAESPDTNWRGPPHPAAAVSSIRPSDRPAAQPHDSRGRQPSDPQRAAQHRNRQAESSGDAIPLPAASAAVIPFGLAERDALLSSMTAEIATSAVEPTASLTSAQTSTDVLATPQRRDREVTSAPAKIHAKKQPLTKSRDDSTPGSEQLTARVTARLVSLNQNRFLRRKLLWWILVIVGFYASVFVTSLIGRAFYDRWLQS